VTPAERAELVAIRELVEQLPSGIDTEAREDDTSPEDMVAHIGGLIWRRLTALLEAV
jgi:hypothetical protein